MIKYTISSKTTDNEILLALLSDSSFESFELIEDGLYAYLKNEGDIPEVETSLSQLQNQFSFGFDKETIPYQNWNKIWESNFQPVLVDDFCYIRADFHEPMEGFEFEVIINPKMAFGTGHHETSFMMLQLMREIEFENKTVFDYGAGTGILSVIAAYKNASSVLAIDIEEESYLNTIENAERNHVSTITSKQGILTDIPSDASYDIILANINRKVLLDSALPLLQHCKPNTVLLLSGILKVDVELVQSTYEAAGFQLEKMSTRGEWVAMKYILA